MKASDSSAKHVLRCLHSGKKGGNPWIFVAGRIEERGVSGLQVNQWSMVIVRRERR